MKFIFESVFNSFLLIAAAEMGDKTQLLAFVLASRFRKPWTILCGILLATILNHFMAALFGNLISQMVPQFYLKWILGFIFIVFALWILIPDKDEELNHKKRFGAFLTTLIAFFLAEMGDKTQLSTVALAAKYNSIYTVTFGTTLGMIFSDGIAVFLGEKFTHKISMRWVRIISSLLFIIFGVVIILGF